MNDIENIANKIQNEMSLNENERNKASKILMLVSQAKFETSRSMFISGYAGETDNSLPEYVFICPEYGADFSIAYKKKE